LSASNWRTRPRQKIAASVACFESRAEMLTTLVEAETGLPIGARRRFLAH
jgi:hypothetical protein